MYAQASPPFSTSRSRAVTRRAGATLVLATIALAALPACKARGEAQSCVAVVATNDMHGAIEPHLLEGTTPPMRYGGLLVVASYIARLRDHYGPRLLLVDAGDIYQGTLVSNLSQGRAMIDGMNWLGYDAGVIGNHEFDFGAGPEHHEGDGQTLSAQERLGVIKARIADAKFPFLVANVLDRESKQPVTWPNTVPFTLVEKAGLRIGLIGVSTPDTARLTRPQNVAALEFAQPAPIVIDAARQLREQGAQLVVLIAHMGSGCTKTDDANDLSSCELDGELFKLLSGLPQGTVDVAVGGHSHEVVAHWINGVATMQSSARARALGWIDACVRPNGGIDRDHSVIHAPTYACLDAWSDGTCKTRPRGGPMVTATFMGKLIEPSAPLGKILEGYSQQVQAQATKPIGIALKEPLVRDNRSTGESPLGVAVCEALRMATGAPLALQNRGGLRGDLPSGPLTYGQLFEVIPFDNRVATIDLTGAELTAALTNVLERKGGGAPLMVGIRAERGTDGLHFRLADGKPLVPNTHYLLATNDYLATGGEGLAKALKDVGPERVTVLDLEVRDALMAYLQKTGEATLNAATAPAVPRAPATKTDKKSPKKAKP